jgi:hypothetical protein
LHRLVAVTAQGMADPAVFERRVGKPQAKAVWSGASWLHLYVARHPDRLKGIPLAQVKPAQRWVGGDLMVLDRVLSKQK